ncbi:bifunctional diguanylate cyclase/phosphodiesterase [Frateuria aurantia]
MTSRLAGPASADHCQPSAEVRRHIDILENVADIHALLDICRRVLALWQIEGELEWQRDAQQISGSAGAIRLVQVPDGSSLQLLRGGRPPLDEASLANLHWLGSHLERRLATLAELERLRQANRQLQDSERLLKAVYAIAELSNDHLSLPELMRGMHAIIGRLIYAENIYFVVSDSERQRVRYAYYVDALDPAFPDPDEWVELAEIEDSITWHLLTGGRPLLGTIGEIESQITGRLRPIGAVCTHLLAVPLLRDGSVVGGLVVQSYKDDVHFNAADRKLLVYVAQHMQTVLERHQSQEDLERRVIERTTALQEANTILRQQVLQRQRGEQLQAALFRIAELANLSDSLENIYPAIHRVIGGLLYARNFYIALLDKQEQILNFPYAVDEYATYRPARPHAHGLTEYVLKCGKAQLFSRAQIEQMQKSGEIVHEGALPLYWLGVPLASEHGAIGVLAVKSYRPEYSYEARDQDLLTFVSYHIVNALQRKDSTDSLRRAYANLEQRVTERTHALAMANRDLRLQIVERERIEQRLKHEALHDSLTGLPNRAFMLQRLEQALYRYRQNHDNLFAVLFVDLDRFKVINDSVGHLVGDDLLLQAGGRLRSGLKASDVVARLGGDEFAVLVEGIGGQRIAVDIAERLIASLRVPFHLDGKEIFTSASIGIALPTPHYTRPEELLRDADAAMYRAKNEGKQRAAVFDERLRQEALSLLDLENDLRRALARNEFVPFYQPLVDLETREIVGYEALLRWRHPERGLLPPKDFLEVACENGTAEPIDWQIFEKVFVDAAELTRDGRYVSINVSASHFLSPDLDRMLLALIAQHQIDTRSLRLEVTEGTLLENPPQVKQILDSLRSHGVVIALDDFGTGYSSLSYLQRYPISTLKIDGAFVAELSDTGNEQNLSIIQAILAMARTLHMDVVAECIETEEQFRILRQLGCRYGQGFLFSKAQPLEHWQTTGSEAETDEMAP